MEGFELPRCQAITKIITRLPILNQSKSTFVVHFPNVKSSYEEHLKQENLLPPALRVISIWARTAPGPQDGAKP